MTSVYQDSDFLALYKQKQRVWNAFMTVTAVYSVFCLAWLIFYTTLPYKDPLCKPVEVIVSVISVVYVVFAFPFMAIKYNRLRKYYKVLFGFSDGIKNEETNYFYCFEEHKLQKDNIDVSYCIFEVWNKKKEEWMEREAYFDMEKPLPDFESGDLVQYIVQSNFIVQYRILEKGVLEFEEVEEGEDALQETSTANE